MDIEPTPAIETFRLYEVQADLPEHAKIIALLSQVMDRARNRISTQERGAIAVWFARQYEWPEKPSNP